MARIDIKDIDKETLAMLDEQCEKYGIKSRADYVRLLIRLDIMSNVTQLLCSLNTINIADILSGIKANGGNDDKKPNTKSRRQDKNKDK